MCFKPYQTSQNLTPSFHLTLLFTSPFIALLHQVPTQLLSLFQVLIVSCSPPYHFPTHILHCPAVTSVFPQPLIRILPSILSLLHYHKMSSISFPKCCFLRNYFILLQLKKSSLFNQVLQFLNLWREAGKS